MWISSFQLLCCVRTKRIAILLEKCNEPQEAAGDRRQVDSPLSPTAFLIPRLEDVLRRDLQEAGVRRVVLEELRPIDQTTIGTVV